MNARLRLRLIAMADHFGRLVGNMLGASVVPLIPRRLLIPLYRWLARRGVAPWVEICQCCSSRYASAENNYVCEECRRKNAAAVRLFFGGRK